MLMDRLHTQQHHLTVPAPAISPRLQHLHPQCLAQCWAGLFFQLSLSYSDTLTPHLTHHFARSTPDLLVLALLTTVQLARIDHLLTRSSSDKRPRLPLQMRAPLRNSRSGHRKRTILLSSCEARA